MSKLTPQQQRILELTYFAAMPPESIAKTLNMPIESVDESITMIRYALWHLLDD